MIGSALLASLAAAGAATGHVIRAPGLGNWCGTPRPSPEHLAMSEHLAVKEEAARFQSLGAVRPAAVIVDTYFHIVSTSTSESDGYLSVRPLSKPDAPLRSTKRGGGAAAGYHSTPLHGGTSSS
jgi:hypothetical protein